MAFSIMGVLAVLLETLRPIAPLLIALLVVEAALLGWLLLRRGHWQVGRAVRVSAGLGVLTLLLSLAALPGFTRASFSNLHGLLDHGILALASLGFGFVAALLCYPPVQLALSKPST